MDAVCHSVESEVNDALRYPLNFHKVNKIVLCLGKTAPPVRDYIELLGVGQKQVPTFDLTAYEHNSTEGRIEMLRRTVRDELAWFEDSFQDANFVSVARRNLPWLQQKK